jgi:hypothetical protein|tara:strand:- start:702 stop:941 length:240 start_codon:yes stop_codon:yes gene_type:complete
MHSHQQRKNGRSFHQFKTFGTLPFEIERSITFALLELFPSYSHGASEQLAMPFCRQRGNGGVFTLCQEVYKILLLEKIW